MTATLAGYFDEPVRAPHPPQSKTKRPNKFSRSCHFGLGPTTDIKQWLLKNGPRDYAELTHQRKSFFLQQAFCSKFVFLTLDFFRGERPHCAGRTEGRTLQWPHSLRLLTAVAVLRGEAPALYTVTP